MINKKEGNMKKAIFGLLFLVLSGCIGFPPVPTDADYSQAVETFPEAKSAVYLVKAFWFPNTYRHMFALALEDPTYGILALNEDSMIFAIYINSQGKFLQAFKASYSDITWIHIEKRSIGSNYMTIQVNNTVHGFECFFAYKNNGESVDRSEVFDFLLKKVNKK